MNFHKWISNNTKSLETKEIFFVGATGSIGFETLKILVSLGANVTIGARSKAKAEGIIAKVKEEYPDATLSIFEIDISSLGSIDALISSLSSQNKTFDVLINNAGVYHLPPKKSVDGYDITFATNTLGCIYLCEKMIPYIKENGKILVTSSISHRFYELNYENLSTYDVKNKLKKYSLSKRMMLEAFIHLKRTCAREDLAFNLVHPGICATELFGKSHGKLFMTLVFPLMKLLFHSPKVAACSLTLGVFDSTKENEWIGPRGFIGGWGYPKKSKLKKKTQIQNEVVYKYLNSFYPKEDC